MFALFFNTFFSTFDISLLRYGLQPTVNSPSSPSKMSFTQIMLKPSLTLVKHIDALSLNATALGQHFVLLRDTINQTQNLSRVSFHFKLTMPFFRDFLKNRHIFSPSLKYRFVPFQKSHLMEQNGETFNQPSLHRLEIGGYTTLVPNRKMRSSIRADIKEVLFNDSVSDRISPQYLHGAIRLSSTYFNLMLDAAWDHVKNTPSFWGIDLEYFHDKIHIRFLSRSFDNGQGPHLEIPIENQQTIYARPSFNFYANRLLESLLSTDISITSALSFNAGTRLNLLPNVSINTLWYGFSLVSDCNCYELVSTVIHNPETSVPTLLFQFNFIPD